MVGEKCSWQETNGPAPVARDNNQLVVVSIAERGAESTSERQPIQLQYRNNDVLLKECEKKAEAMRSCPRPVILGREGQRYDHYLTSLGKIGTGIHSRPLTQRIEKVTRRNLRAAKIVGRIFSNRAVVGGTG